MNPIHRELLTKEHTRFQQTLICEFRAFVLWWPLTTVAMRQAEEHHRKSHHACKQAIPADGKDIEALDPFNNNPNKWHPATVEESRKGVTEEGSDEGDESDLRFWVRYKVSGLCQWLNAREVRAVSATAAAAAAPASGDTSGSSHNSTISKLQVVNLSRRSGRPGDELWLLLSSDALDEKVHTPIVHFGQMEAEGARLRAPNLVACTVPDDATEGVTGVRLSVAPGGAVSPGCSMRFEVLQ